MTAFLVRISALCLVAILCAAAPAGAATTWHASPDGAAPGPCSAASPCSAKFALHDNLALADGDTVVLAGGDYDISATLFVAKRISIEGAAGGPPTRLIARPAVQNTLDYAASTPDPIPVHITDLEITNQFASLVGAALVAVNPTTGAMLIERVRAETTGGR
jgi:hypothetical protein